MTEETLPEMLTEEQRQIVAEVEAAMIGRKRLSETLGTKLRENGLKRCSKCKIIKLLEAFCEDKVRISGKNPQCKKCCKEYYQKTKSSQRVSQSNYYQRNRAFIAQQNKKRYQEKKEVIKARIAVYQHTHKEKLKVWSTHYHQKNRASIAARNKRYYQQNHADITKKRRSRATYRRQTDPIYRFKRNLRGRISNFIKKESFSAHTLELLGADAELVLQYLCDISGISIKEFHEHRRKYHVDHIIPINLYDPAKPEQQFILCNYRNLRILTAKENLSRPKDGSDIVLADIHPLIDRFGEPVIFDILLNNYPKR